MEEDPHRYLPIEMKDKNSSKYYHEAPNDDIRNITLGDPINVVREPKFKKNSAKWKVPSILVFSEHPASHNYPDSIFRRLTFIPFDPNTTTFEA